MESTLNIILMLVVLAVIDELNAISPYLGFATLVIVLLVGLVTLGYTLTKWYYLIKNKGK
ncbi:MAG: hypothetical protein FVQ77_14000 [Cytophagales bacterium]|nr:hypothetical protein [Cytophagales bacterium]